MTKTKIFEKVVEYPDKDEGWNYAELLLVTIFASIFLIIDSNIGLPIFSGIYIVISLLVINGSILNKRKVYWKEIK